MTVWAKYLGASERSYLALSENALGYWILGYHLQDANPSKYRILVFFIDAVVIFDISALDISRAVTPKPINRIIF